MKILPILALLTLLASCGPTTTGNPVTRSAIALRMEDQQPFAFLRSLSDRVIAPAAAATSNVKFCFKRLRFKPDSSTEGSNFDLYLGEVDIVPGGTNLISVNVPQGEYTRIEFDLTSDCDGTSKPSVSFTNDQGTFSTTENMTIKFNGNYEVADDDTLTLNVDALFDALDPISANNQIKVTLEAVAGDF